MDQTIIFDKTYHERLIKYSEIFSDNLSSNQVMNDWSVYLETAIEPFGWQAIWKIPRETCEKLHILFPSLALVYVDKINFENLSANIKILSIQSKIDVSDCLTACLIHLTPTEDQDETLVLNLNKTSDALDNLRFFFKYLWRPWDNDNVENDWFKKHLIPRLKLYNDLKQGVITKSFRNYYRLQLIESKEKYYKFKKLQEEIQEDDLDCFDNEIIDELRDLHNSLTKLQIKLDLFEKPIVREAILNKKNHESKIKFWIVLTSDCELEYYFEFIQNVKAFTNSESDFQSAKSLQDALDSASVDDTIFLGSGKHIVQSSGNFVEGGKIVNVNYPDEAIITTTNEHLLFSFISGDITLQNLSFHLISTHNGIRARNGANLKLENCTFLGYKNSDMNNLISTQLGILADPGTKLNLNNCQFSHLGTALNIVGGTATLLNCEINNVRCALRAQNSASFTFYSCKISQFLDCVVHIEVDKLHDDDRDTIYAGIEILETIPNVKVVETNIKEPHTDKTEYTSAVIMTKKLDFCPIRDILSNPAFNVTLNKTLDYY